MFHLKGYTTITIAKVNIRLGHFSIFPSNNKVHSNIDKTKTLMENGSLMKVERIRKFSPWSLMQVKSIAECYNLQYFRPSLSYLFCLFLTGLFTLVFLYALLVQRVVLLVPDVLQF